MRTPKLKDLEQVQVLMLSLNINSYTLRAWEQYLLLKETWLRDHKDEESFSSFLSFSLDQALDTGPDDIEDFHEAAIALGKALDSDFEGWA